jgi:hypothetical protein
MPHNICASQGIAKIAAKRHTIRRAVGEASKSKEHNYLRAR